MNKHPLNRLMPGQRLIALLWGLLVVIMITGCGTGAASDPTPTTDEEAQITASAQTYLTFIRDALADQLGIAPPEI